ncbi:hypothetical protein Tcan_10824 [Toxocara canis]|uniref:Pepsin inhibitor-3-like repeated domain-containing protein n=1 Tax=Toxocara canis TaxID=6265 RepID=A0A0B2UX17_TOXCA|nr:hypothetical protein Tcan_10824 [Toxocara canis]
MSIFTTVAGVQATAAATSQHLIMKTTVLSVLFFMHPSLTNAVELFDNEVIVFPQPTGSCVVADGNLFLNGFFIRALTADDRAQLGEYEKQVNEFYKNLQLRMQHKANQQINYYRQYWNSVFGPEGTYYQRFVRPFQEMLQSNTAVPTALPLLPEDQTVEIPQTPYPNPPAFCTVAINA